MRTLVELKFNDLVSIFKSISIQYIEKEIAQPLQALNKRVPSAVAITVLNRVMNKNPYRAPLLTEVNRLSGFLYLSAKLLSTIF